MGPVRHPLDCALTPLEALRALRGQERPFALVGRWAGSRAVLGFGPSRVVSGGFPPDLDGVEAPWPGFVGGGWVGALGYALGEQVERLPPAPPRPIVTPVAELGFHDWVLRLDDDGVWWFEALSDERAPVDEVRALLAAGPDAAPWRLSGMALHGGGADAHRAAVAACVERIAAGDLFQANLCVRLEGRFTGSAVDAFADAAAVLEPAYGAFVGRPDGALLSFSPELFLRRSGSAVETAPIKGTAPRSGSASDDAARSALVASAKDAAEHVMIVDLMRNDLGRVAAYGSVEAAPEPDVEPHPGVWHLVSRVRATLRDGVGDEELLCATFPPGSVTGAPKVAALKMISELEGTAREAYTGAIGLISPCSGLELNVAIRTLEVAGEAAWLGCGGGIVADSDPDAELREALGKARPIVSALGATVPDVAPAARPPRVLDRLGVRPDPRAGVFETVAVREGRPMELDRHLRRLAASVAVLYGLSLPADLATRIGPMAAGAELARLRIVVAPEGAVDLSVAPVAAGAPTPVVLSPVALAGGLGAYKWADRGPLAGRDLLLVDLDGAVLEASTANVWIVEGERLVTPPADGRILPGVTRERLLLAADVDAAEEPVALERLEQADGLLVTSSIRLAAPAALGGAEPSDVAVRTAERLRAALLPVPVAAR